MSKLKRETGLIYKGPDLAPEIRCGDYLKFVQENEYQQDDFIVVISVSSQEEIIKCTQINSESIESLLGKCLLTADESALCLVGKYTEIDGQIWLTYPDSSRKPLKINRYHIILGRVFERLSGSPVGRGR